MPSSLPRIGCSGWRRSPWASWLVWAWSVCVGLARVEDPARGVFLRWLSQRPEILQGILAQLHIVVGQLPGAEGTGLWGPESFPKALVVPAHRLRRGSSFPPVRCLCGRRASARALDQVLFDPLPSFVLFGGDGFIIKAVALKHGFDLAFFLVVPCFFRGLVVGGRALLFCARSCCLTFSGLGGSGAKKLPSTSVTLSSAASAVLRRAVPFNVERIERLRGGAHILGCHVGWRQSARVWRRPFDLSRLPRLLPLVPRLLPALVYR